MNKQVSVLKCNFMDGMLTSLLFVLGKKRKEGKRRRERHGEKRGSGGGGAEEKM